MAETKKKKTDKERFIEYIIKRMKAYRHLLNADEFDIVVPDYASCDDEKDTAFWLDRHHPYMQVRVCWTQRALDCYIENPHSLNRMLLHEMLHLLTWDLWEAGKERYTTPNALWNENEKLVDRLSVALDRIMNKKDYV